ncbi:hypothetical protein HMPREF9444_01156 [Succinatimonas hippei YIT 12066]|uniref:Uncharacterized protein n=1 Tax=Succinatimonas hippei (strain DSM 22608 / JCM 16073 / KCTC 15190 / YIT 12066) TaxID=762983 RepID=E8LKB8_SUCHY|nr:hypothetical protein HMPREF9444_01156 [Succinatimonas hippei YIT 12066]
MSFLKFRKNSLKRIKSLIFRVDFYLIKQIILNKKVPQGRFRPSGNFEQQVVFSDLNND